KGGTVYLTAADASGMMVSFIQSNFMGFGSGVVVDGVSLQNRGASFVVKPGHPNCVGPKKRPFQTIIPGFLTKDGAPVMSFGVMGGNMQPQGHTQVIVRIADYGQSPQAASDGPRFRFVQGMDVSVEDGRFPPATLEELQRRGHRIVTLDDYNQFGSAQLIWKLDGGYFVLWESHSIGRYLAAKHSAGKLWPTDLKQRADAERWMDWTYTFQREFQRPVFWPLVRTPPEKRDMKAIEAACKTCAQLL